MNANMFAGIVWATAVCGTLAAGAQPPARVKVDVGKDQVVVTIDDRPFTTYRFAPTADDPMWHRPYFWPVAAADGAHVTSDQWRLSQKTKTDHPWHRSIWIGHGDVGGVDHWLFKDKKQKHVRFAQAQDDGFVEELEWEGAQADRPVLRETRTIRFIAYDDGARAIDVASIFVAPESIKLRVKPLNVSGVEAGFCCVRVAEAMSGDAQRQIVSSAGASGEKDCRSKPAGWCDYSGRIDGKRYGVAMFDHPDNPGHPSPWHVRSFGLLAHIGIHDWTMEKDRPVGFRHRIVVHAGSAVEARIAEKYGQFILRTPSPTTAPASGAAGMPPSSTATRS